MGISPLSGIPMTTRSGSIDPSIYYILFKKGYSSEEINIDGEKHLFVKFEDILAKIE